MMSVVTPDALLTLNMTIDLYLTKQYQQLGLKCYCCGSQQHLAPECPEASLRIDREIMQQNWLEKRQYHSKIIKNSRFSPNFRRLSRKKVHKAKRYSLANVFSSKGFNRLKGANYMLSKRLTNYNTPATTNLVDIEVPEDFEDMEFCPLSSEEASEQDEHSSSPHSEEILCEGLESLYVRSAPLHTYPNTTHGQEKPIASNKSDARR